MTTAAKKPEEISRGQQSVEDQGDGRAVNERGVYVHPESGAVLEALSQAAGDAFVRMGFRPATDKEVTEYDARVAAANKEKIDTYKKQQESQASA